MPPYYAAIGAFLAGVALCSLAGAAGVFIPVAAPFIGLPAFALLWIIVSSAEKIASFPFAQLQLPTFPWVLAVLAYAIELWIAMPARAGSAPHRRPS